MKDIEISSKLLQAYTQKCKNICKQYQINQTEFDIIMFLYNNPEYKSAKDIVRVRGIKANLVSMNVDKLTQKGLLKQEEVKEDRRKYNLILKEKAILIAKQGKDIQNQFINDLFKGIDDKQKEIFQNIINIIYKNIEGMI